MRVGVFFSEIVRVVCYDERQPRFLVQAQNALVDDGLVADAVILQFEIKVIFSKDLMQCQGIFLCTVIVPVAQSARNFTGKAGRERNETLRMFAQKV